LRKKAAKEDKKIYVLQDSTFYTETIKNGESFYFRYRFQNDQVEWLFVSNRINHRVSYKLT
jgi:hypothetical protein